MNIVRQNIGGEARGGKNGAPMKTGKAKMGAKQGGGDRETVPTGTLSGNAGWGGPGEPRWSPAEPTTPVRCQPEIGEDRHVSIQARKAALKKCETKKNNPEKKKKSRQGPPPKTVPGSRERKRIWGKPKIKSPDSERQNNNNVL